MRQKHMWIAVLILPTTAIVVLIASAGTSLAQGRVQPADKNSPPQPTIRTLQESFHPT